MNEPSTALSVTHPSELSDLAMSPQSVLRQAALIQQVMQAVMRDGEHYGVIPGTSREGQPGKKSLLKPGAEKLCFTFGLSNRLEITVDNLPGLHREYRIICNLFDRSGNLRGQGVGSASTMESKHRYRGAAGRPCPKCGAVACVPSKKDFGGGYYCNAKAGGCGWSTKAGTDEARSLDRIAAVRQENQDPADQYNTVLKMAKKRALVDAVLTATAASDIFAQDLEDLEDKIDEPAATPAARTAGVVLGEPATGTTQSAPASTSATQAPAETAPAPHPSITTARDLYRALEKKTKGLGAKLMPRLCALHGAAEPKAIPAEKLDAFGKDSMSILGDLDQAEASIAEWERIQAEGGAK